VAIVNLKSLSEESHESELARLILNHLDEKESGIPSLLIAQQVKHLIFWIMDHLFHLADAVHLVQVNHETRVYVDPHGALVCCCDAMRLGFVHAEDFWL
jgi:hypothetical protein